MTDLIARLEEGGEGEQRELLERAYRVIFPWAGGGEFSKAYGDYWGKYEPFAAKLDAEAYIDAALMLVPADCCIHQMGNTPDNPPTSKWWCALWREGDEEDLGEVEAATPALAIASACLRARREG